MEVDFLNATFNLERNTYRLYKKPNDNLTHINTLSNHPPLIIKHLTNQPHLTLQVLKYLNNLNNFTSKCDMVRAWLLLQNIQ